MTSETEKAKAWSAERRKKAIDWFSEDVLAEAWKAGYFAKADFYVRDCVIQGLEKTIKELEEKLSQKMRRLFSTG